MKEFINNNRRVFGYSILAISSILFIVLVFLPAEFFDQGSAKCVSVILFNKQCYGCGMTRAIQHLIHLEFKEALNFNWLSFVVLPILVYAILWEVRRLVK